MNKEANPAKSKKTLVIILAVCLVLAIAAFVLVKLGVFSDDPNACGDDLVWSFENGVLTISGEGDMDDYVRGSPHYSSPWSNYNIKKVVIKPGVTSIGEDAFSNCDSIKSISISDTVTSIGAGAFSGCRSLTNISIPDSVTIIESGTFEYCTSLKSLPLSCNVTSIGSYAFYNCSSLTNIVIPSSVTSIGVYAFSSCESLTSISMLDGVTSIGECAFIWCESLVSISIPDSITFIGDSAFMGCNSLSDVYYSGSPAQWDNIDRTHYNYELTSATIYYNWEAPAEAEPSSSKKDHESADGTQLCGDKVSWSLENGTLTISGKGDMYDYFEPETVPWHTSRPQIRKVVIKKGVTSIGQFAFDQCGALESVTIPNSVTKINAYAFNGCTSLKNVAIPGSVTFIGYFAFGSCTSLTDITMSSVNDIVSCAFQGCTALTSVGISTSLTSIGSWAFLSCDSLTDVYYSGSEAQWSGISIDDGNDDLMTATIHFNS